MSTFVLILGILVFWLGIYWSLQGLTEIELEQVSLLPFADDPSVARRMSESTGRHCESVVMPALEPCEEFDSDRFVA